MVLAWGPWSRQAASRRPDPITVGVRPLGRGEEETRSCAWGRGGVGSRAGVRLGGVGERESRESRAGVLGRGVEWDEG